MKEWIDKNLYHLILYLENGRKIFISTNTVTDSGLCNIGREMMGKEWNKSKVKVAQTCVTKRRV